RASIADGNAAAGSFNVDVLSCAIYFDGATGSAAINKAFDLAEGQRAAGRLAASFAFQIFDADRTARGFEIHVVFRRNNDVIVNFEIVAAEPAAFRASHFRFDGHIIAALVEGDGVFFEDVGIGAAAGFAGDFDFDFVG